MAFSNLSKTYSPSGFIYHFQDVQLENEFLVQKSTLINTGLELGENIFLVVNNASFYRNLKNMLLMSDARFSGAFSFCGQAINADDFYSDYNEQMCLRRAKVALVSSTPMLINNLTLRQNILLSVRQPERIGQVQHLITELAEKFFSLEALEKRPTALTYQEKIWGTFIRAVVQNPKVILFENILFRIPDMQIKDVLKIIDEYLTTKGCQFIAILVQDYPIKLDGIEKKFCQHILRTEWNIHKMWLLEGDHLELRNW